MHESKKKIKLKKKSRDVRQVVCVWFTNAKEQRYQKNKRESEPKIVTIYAKFSIEYITNTINNNVGSKIEFIKLQIPFWNFTPSSAPHFTVQLSSFLVCSL